MRRLAVGTLFCSLLFLSACDRWPPYQKDIVDHFYENDAKISALRTKLIASDYSMVSVLADGNVLAYSYDESTGESSPIDAKSYPDEDEWEELFSDTHLAFISYSHLDNKSVTAGLFYFSGSYDEESQWGAEFIHDPNLSDSVDICSRSKPTTDRGTCAVELSDGWWVRYVWSLMPDFE